MNPVAGPDAPPDPAAFRRVMARWPTGVSVVTARDARHDSGLTVNAFLSISLTPPLVLVSLTHDAETTPVIQASRQFAVNVLAADQREISERFAKLAPPEEKFTGLALHRGVTGAALLDGALAVLECSVTQTIAAGDHLLVLGEVRRVELGADREPLLFFRSAYAQASGANRLELPGSRR